MTRTHASVCLFGFDSYCRPFRRSNCPQNLNFGGVNRPFPAKRTKFWNVHIIKKTTASIITKFCRATETPKYSLWVVRICPKQSKMADGNMAQWFVWALQTLSVYKILRVQKSKMAAANIKRLQYLHNRLTNFDEIGTVMCVCPLEPGSNKILQFQISKMAAAAILKIRKITIYLQWNYQFLRNLAQWCN